MTESANGGLGEKRQGVSQVSSSAELCPSTTGSDQISALNAGVSGPGKFRDTSASAGLTDYTVLKAVSGQTGLRRAPKHNSFGPRGARLRPLTVGQVLLP